MRSIDGRKALLATAALLAGLAAGTPEEFQADLVAAHSNLAALEYCLSADGDRITSGSSQAFSVISARYLAAEVRALGLFGQDALLADALLAAPLAPKCGERDAGLQIKAANQALDEVEAQLTAIEAPLSRGLWFGLFPICADTAWKAAVRADQSLGIPALVIEFKPEAAALFSAYSARFAGDPLLRMAVRLNGAVVADPPVYEPLRKVALSGLDERDLRAAAELATTVCS